MWLILQVHSYTYVCVCFFVVFVAADSVFCESSEQRAPEDKQVRAKQTFDEMMNYLPGGSSSVSYAYQASSLWRSEVMS